MEREHTMTAYAGRHRKTSAADYHVHRIVTRGLHASILNDGTLYLTLTDADTGNMLGVDFEPAAINPLRRVLDKVAS